MTLKEIRDWLKPQISSDVLFAYIGKIDSSKENTICIYGREGASDKIAIGGLSNTSTATKTISVLVQWSKNCDVAEQKSKNIYDIFNGHKAVINGTDVFFMMKNDEPIYLGVNANDIYEYVINLKLVYKKG